MFSRSILDFAAAQSVNGMCVTLTFAGSHKLELDGPFSVNKVPGDGGVYIRYDSSKSPGHVLLIDPAQILWIDYGPAPLIRR